MLAHQPHGARIAADLEDRHDRVADDIALSRRKHMQHIACSRLQGAALSCRRGGIHEVKSLAARWRFRRSQHVYEADFFPDLFKIAEGFLFDRSETAGNV